MAWANTIAFAPGQRMRVEVLASTGTNPTTLARQGLGGRFRRSRRARCCEQTDGTAALQVPGGIGIEHYQSSSTTNGPVTTVVETITATIPSTNPPPNTAPVAAFTATVTDL